MSSRRIARRAARPPDVPLAPDMPHAGVGAWTYPGYARSRARGLGMSSRREESWGLGPVEVRGDACGLYLAGPAAWI
jgi:hypothetical protein